MNDAFAIDSCIGFRESFVEVPGAYQFYDPLKSVTSFRQYLQDKLCTEKDTSCLNRLAVLDDADYIDLKYDAASQELVGSAFFGQSEVSENVEIHKASSIDKVEIGILMHENPIAEESFTVGGQLHVIGNQKFGMPPQHTYDAFGSLLSLDPVLFTFPARHHAHKSSFSLDLSRPTGLHPKLRLSVTSPNTPPHEDCTLNAYFTLPRFLFVDKYQLSTSNPQLLDSLNLVRIRSLSGEADLEEPVWSSTLWGSSLLLELAPAAENFEIPLHLRYLPPAQNETMETVEFAAPSVFWACRSEEWSRMGNSPFDRTRLGWEQWFPEPTMYHYLSPAEGEGAWKQIEVPVLDLRSAQIVKWGTVAAILGGFLWVVYKIILSAIGSKEDVKVEKKKQ